MDRRHGGTTRTSGQGPVEIRGYGVSRNSLVFLVGHVGFEPTTS
jgi:hypothetical protein